MFLQAQRAFGVSPERHYRLLHAAAEEKPRIIVLNVLVQAADNLEAKDANGKPCIYILVCLLKRISSIRVDVVCYFLRDISPKKTASLTFHQVMSSITSSTEKKHSINIIFEENCFSNQVAITQQ